MFRQMLCLALLWMSLGMATSAGAAQGTVIITDEKCDYLLLDSSQGQILVKLIKGSMPKRGDQLAGDFKQRDFSDLTLVSDRSKISVWVDLVDPNTTKALMRYRQYCP